MADSIKIKGGNGEVPALENREIAYSKDEKALYIGTNGTKEGNMKVADANWEARIKALEDRLAAMTS